MVLLENPVAFWEQRHGALDEWRSGGDRGLTPEENYEFYAFRLGRIIELIRKYGSCERGQRILDAGAGRGHFTDGLVKCGHRVRGIDTSSTAIDWAIEHYGQHFEVASIDEYRPRALFDVAICIDVLFHILDDEVWQASIRSLGRAAAAESLLLITDVFCEQRVIASDYIVYRSLREYDDILSTLGFVRCEIVHYQFGVNMNQFAVYRRAV